MVVLITIFAHNLSLTHSFTKQRIDSVRRSISCSSAGCRRHVWTQPDLIRPFCCRCLRHQRDVSLQVRSRAQAGALSLLLPSGCAETQRSRRVPAQTPRPVPDCSRSAACFSWDQPCGRPEGKGQTADVCCTLWSEQSKRKWIYKHSLRN